MVPLTAQVLHCYYVRHIDKRSIIYQLRNDRLGVRAQGRSDMLYCCADIQATKQMQHPMH